MNLIVKTPIMWGGAHREVGAVLPNLTEEQAKSLLPYADAVPEDGLGPVNAMKKMLQALGPQAEAPAGEISLDEGDEAEAPAGEISLDEGDESDPTDADPMPDPESEAAQTTQKKTPKKGE